MVISFPDRDFLREIISKGVCFMNCFIVFYQCWAAHTRSTKNPWPCSATYTHFYHLVLKQVLQLEMIMSLKSSSGNLLLLNMVCHLERDGHAWSQFNCLLKKKKKLKPVYWFCWSTSWSINPGNQTILEWFKLFFPEGYVLQIKKLIEMFFQTTLWNYGMLFIHVRYYSSFCDLKIRAKMNSSTLLCKNIALTFIICSH